MEFHFHSSTATLPPMRIKETGRLSFTFVESEKLKSDSCLLQVTSSLTLNCIFINCVVFSNAYKTSKAGIYLANVLMTFLILNALTFEYAGLWVKNKYFCISSNSISYKLIKLRAFSVHLVKDVNVYLETRAEVFGPITAACRGRALTCVRSDGRLLLNELAVR